MTSLSILVRILALTLPLTAFGASEPTPNVVWIVAEDMSPWLASYGDDTVPTPNLDRLAFEGTRYANAFATSPVCAPARSTLITGQYATAIGSMHMRTGNPSGAALARDPGAYDGIPSYEASPPIGWGDRVRCFPELLRAAGYYCSNRAKRDYQFEAPVTVWDESSGKAHWRNRAEGQPFFAVFNLGITHESGTFQNRKAPEAVADPESVPLPPYYPDTPVVRADVARTYDNIAAMDAQVGRLIGELEANGLLDETVVFFYGDHGVGLPRGKRCVYDSGTRVPLIVRGPGVDAGVVSDRLVSFVDFAPTVLSLAGLEPPEIMPGAAFLGDFVGEPRLYAFAHADRMDSVLDRSRAVTDGRYRLVRNFMTDRPRLYPVAYAENIPMTAELDALRESGDATAQQWQIVSPTKPELELYDSMIDPHEILNLAEAPEHAERIARMHAALENWIESTGDLGMLDETTMVRTRLWPPDGKQPATAGPVVTRDPVDEPAGATPRVTLSISCTTPGASLGYRAAGEGPWRVYTGPVAVPSGATLEVMAHRIGFVPARVISEP